MDIIKKKFIYLISSFMLILSACSSNPELKPALNKNTHKNYSHKLYLLFDEKKQVFTYLTDKQPQYIRAAELSTMKQMGFYASIVKDEGLTSSFDLGKSPNYRIRECTDNHWSMLANINPIHLARGFVCESYEHFDYKSFNTDIEMWFTKNNLVLDDFMSHYDNVKRKQDKFLKLYNEYKAQNQDILREHKKSVNNLVNKYSISYEHNYKPIVSQEFFIHITNDSYDQHVAIREFQCKNNCSEDLIALEEKLDHYSDFQKAMNLDIESLQSKSKSKLALLESSLQSQQLKKLRKDSNEMLLISDRFDINVTKYTLRESDSNLDMIDKNSALKNAIKLAKKNAYINYITGSAAIAYCDTKWTMNFWKDDKNGYVCNQIGKRKWISSCINAYSKIDTPSSNQITKIAIEQWGVK